MPKWVERLKEVPSTCVADGQNGENAMDTSIKPLKEENHLCGRAFTVSMPAGDNLAVLQAISEAQPGRYLSDRFKRVYFAICSRGFCHWISKDLRTWRSGN